MDWEVFDLLEAGLPPSSSTPVSIDISQGNPIWMGTRNRVFEYDLETTEWTVHDPADAGPNFQAYDVKVESENNVWWATGNGLFEYDGTELTRHSYYAPELDLNMETTAFRDLEIENGNKWLTTPYSFCFGGSCFTPAGVIRVSDTDTTYFEADVLGVPETRINYLEIDQNNNPVLVTTSWSTDESYYLTYVDGTWSAPEMIPFDGWVKDLTLGNEDQIYAAYDDFIAIGQNGVWDVIQVDTSEVHAVFALALTSENDIFLGGRTGNTGVTYPSSLGFLTDLKYRLRGTLYSDQNFNGLLDESDQTIRNSFVQALEQNRIILSNNVGGFSMLFSDPGTYEIEGILPGYHTYGIPVDGKHSIMLTEDSPVSNDNDIGFEPDTSAIDLSLSISSLNGANPSFESCYSIDVKNNAPKPMDGELIVAFDNLLTFSSSSTLPSGINGNQFTFTLSEIAWLEINNIRMCLTLPPNPDLLDDTLKINGSITPGEDFDLTPANNVDTLCQPITGPFDPNFIAVQPTGEGENGDIHYTTPQLEYTIHFQNVGTDSARTVRINNPIDLDLDLLSLDVIGSSHDYDLAYNDEGRILEWTFNDIYLPDSTANVAASNGFVKYTIELANNNLGTILTNQVNILFDFNEPIATNITVNTLMDLSVSTFEPAITESCDYDISVLQNELSLRFPPLDQYHLGIYDLSGKLMSAYLVNSTETRVDLTNLPQGAYVVLVASKSCQGKAEIFVK